MDPLFYCRDALNTVGTSPIVFLGILFINKIRFTYWRDETLTASVNLLSFIIVGWGLDFVLGIDSLVVQTFSDHPTMAIVCQIYIIKTFSLAYMEVFQSLFLAKPRIYYDVNIFLEETYDKGRSN